MAKRLDVLSLHKSWKFNAYLKDETLWAGKLVIPHGFVHEQEEQAGQEGQSDEDQTCDLSIKHTHT